MSSYSLQQIEICCKLSQNEVSYWSREVYSKSEHCFLSARLYQTAETNCNRQTCRERLEELSMGSKDTTTHGGRREAVTSVCCTSTFQLVATKHFPLQVENIILQGHPISLDNSATFLETTSQLERKCICLCQKLMTMYSLSSGTQKN